MPVIGKQPNRRAPARMLRGWATCEAEWVAIRRKLDRAGVARQDPLYPLIVEMALLPARLRRIACYFAAVMFIAMSSCLAVPLLFKTQPMAGIRLTHGAEGDLIEVALSKGSRRIPCEQDRYQLCITRPSQ